MVNIDYFWLYVVPIYTLEDVETNLSAILEYYMELNELSHSKIKSLGSTFIGDREAYQAVFAATDSEDTSLELVFTAVKSQNEFGTYLIFASSPDDDQAGKEEMRAITNSLQVNVPVETPMVMTADNKTELKIIYNSNLSKGGVWVLNRSQSENSSFSSLVVYPEEKNVEKKMDYYQDDAAGIEAFNASRFGNSAEEVLAYYQTQNPDFILGERYTRTHGNIDWLLQDFSVTSYSYTFAAAIIEGEVYLVRVLFDDSNVEPATLLFSQILHSVRGL